MVDGPGRWLVVTTPGLRHQPHSSFDCLELFPNRSGFLSRSMRTLSDWFLPIFQYERAILGLCLCNVVRPHSHQCPGFWAQRQEASQWRVQFGGKKSPNSTHNYSVDLPSCWQIWQCSCILTWFKENYIGQMNWSNHHNKAFSASFRLNLEKMDSMDSQNQLSLTQLNTWSPTKYILYTKNRHNTTTH